jgi:hypothetical protein
MVAQPMIGGNQPSTAAVDPERLRAHVVKLSEEFHPRAYTDAENLARCADYIADEFASAGLVVSRQPYEAMGYTFDNVIGRLPGKAAGTIVVGAHYDAYGRTPGADDNASGVAGLIELAYLLRDADLAHSLELVAYCTEEPPFFAGDGMGSVHHARSLADGDETVVAVLVLEMIGYYSDKRWSQGYPLLMLHLFYPSRGNFIGIVGNTKQRALLKRVKWAMRGSTKLPVRSACIPSFVQGVDFSDHRSYWPHGIPAVMITDTAFYRNRHYHGADDTADTLDYHRMAHVVVGVYEAVKAMDPNSDSDFPQ